MQALKVFQKTCGRGGLRSLSSQRVNTKIDLDSAGKVVTKLTLAPGEKAVLCRCWQSAKFPYCDGAHAAHNMATGDNLGPAIVSTLPAAE